jgi:hypothetical protein
MIFSNENIIGILNRKEIRQALLLKLSVLSSYPLMLLPSFCTLWLKQ